MTTTETFRLYEWIVGHQDDVPLVLRLFQNSLDPTIVPTLASFVEATFEGYQEQSIVRAEGKTESDGTVASTQSELRVFNGQLLAETPNQIFGYYVVALFDDAPELLVAWEAYASPLTVNADTLPFGVEVLLAARDLRLP